MTHEEFDDLAALDAVGAATEEERDELQRHRSGCDLCRESERGYHDAASMLALSLEPVAPPEEIKESIIRNIETMEATGEDLDEEDAPERTGFSRWWLAAAAVYFVALFAWSELRVQAHREHLLALEATAQRLTEENQRLQRSTEALRTQIASIAGPQTSMIALAGRELAPSASGRVFLDAGSRRAFVFFHDLPPNAQDRSYQLWIIPKEPASPMSAGVFDPGQDGRATLVVENLPAATEIQGLAVTVEPKGGVSAPSGAMILSSS
ncbi:MAG TPA: anti-sigma factor [Thermoanaerobaculia bacterium]|nr:anti-sigma factor [Thermoanaerobaculia bacterium]